MVKIPVHLQGVTAGEQTISRDELSAYQRARVLAAAIPVFARRGYQATTVDDLLAAGKVGVGNFYSLFEGKEGCFLACLEQVTGEATEQIEEAVAGETDWATRTCIGLAVVLDYLCAEPLRARLVLVEAQAAGVEATARYDRLLDRAGAWLTDGRKASSRSAADLPPNLERASIYGLAFYLQQRLLDASRPKAAELLSEAAPLLLEPIVGADRLAKPLDAAMAVID